MAVLVLILAVVFVGGVHQAEAQVAPAREFFASTLTPEELTAKQAVIETDRGVIVLDLLAEAAPNHVAHFITRALEGAYDGTTFHRVIARGIIQGGDPLSTDPTKGLLYGTGGLGELRFEPNDERHTRGAVSAVRIPGDLDSAGSQFFICISDQPALDGEYTVFARVVEGLNVSQELSTSPANPEGIPSRRLEIMRVTIRERPEPELEPFIDVVDAALGGYRIQIETAFGLITITLRPDLAPNHVRNFMRLAALGVFDGTAFHRVVPGFVIQGGFLPTRRVPLDISQEKFVQTMEPEFSSTPHERGTVSLAHGDDPASGTTSFFIVTASSPVLDGQYSVFGSVVDGFDVLDRIEAVEIDGETPVKRIDVTKVTVLAPMP